MDEKLQEALANPFSKENAYLTWRKNMETAERLRREIREAAENGGAPERELVIRAAEALGMMTDNTILGRIVRQALEGRDAE